MCVCVVNAITREESNSKWNSNQIDTFRLSNWLMEVDELSVSPPICSLHQACSIQLKNHYSQNFVEWHSLQFNSIQLVSGSVHFEFNFSPLFIQINYPNFYHCIPFIHSFFSLFVLFHRCSALRINDVDLIFSFWCKLWCSYIYGVSIMINKIKRRTSEA